MNLLLLSNSTVFGGTFLGHAQAVASDFLGAAPKRVLFVPYAGITLSHDAYTERVAQVLGSWGYQVSGIHQAADPVGAVQSAEAIAVGGGNTFALLKALREQHLLPAIREAVQQGIPYVGWSAGANVAGASIRTTNDMPIVEPGSFDALQLTPYQINPHYTEAQLPNHGGETRADRLAEFLVANPGKEVLGLPEGTWLRCAGEAVHYGGEAGDLRWFLPGGKHQLVTPGTTWSVGQHPWAD